MYMLEFLLLGGIQFNFLLNIIYWINHNQLNSSYIFCSGRGLEFSITPLNERGVIITKFIKEHLTKFSSVFDLSKSLSLSSQDGVLRGNVIPSSDYFPEEERSKQPSLFSLIRAIKDLFSSESSGQLGLYGALGYDLTFQFEPIKLKKERGDDQRDLVMYLPDEVLVVDNQKKASWKIAYEFTDPATKASTKGFPRTMAKSEFNLASSSSSSTFKPRDLERGKYADAVVRAKEEFRVGNLFEVVLSQSFREKLTTKPSVIFRRLCRRNPSPYGFFMNLGR